MRKLSCQSSLVSPAIPRTTQPCADRDCPHLLSTMIQPHPHMPRRAKQIKAGAASHSTAAAQHSSSTAVVPPHPTDRSACGHASTPTPTDPKRSPQSLIAPRRESPSRAKQRRVAPGRAMEGSRVRGVSVEGHPRARSPRHSRHPHLPIAVSERLHLEFARKRCRESEREL